MKIVDELTTFAGKDYAESVTPTTSTTGLSSETKKRKRKYERVWNSETGRVNNQCSNSSSKYGQSDHTKAK